MNNQEITYGIIGSLFLIYFVLSWQYNKIGAGNLEKVLTHNLDIELLNIRHFIGVLTFGVLGYLLFPTWNNLLLEFKIQYSLMLVWIGVVLVLIIILARRSANSKCKERELNKKVDIRQGYSYFILRIIFLLAYEYFFRGGLFFTLLDNFTLLWAILICTLLYVLIHAFDSKAEIIGAVPFGIVLCLLSYNTQTIWIAFIIHGTLSSVYEISIFKCLTLKQRKS